MATTTNLRETRNRTDSRCNRAVPNVTTTGNICNVWAERAIFGTSADCGCSIQDRDGRTRTYRRCPIANSTQDIADPSNGKGTTRRSSTPHRRHPMSTVRASNVWFRSTMVRFYVFSFLPAFILSMTYQKKRAVLWIFNNKRPILYITILAKNRAFFARNLAVVW